jgi:hypothetical protein
MSEPESRSAGAQSRAREGRSDSAEKLLLRLAHAESGYLEAALDNPHLGLPQVARLLRNHRCSGDTLRHLAEREGLVKHREVRLGLATHPATPRPLAFQMLSLLGWSDLVAAAAQPRTPAPVRHQAERLVAERIDSLALGELVSLARMAPRGLFPGLRRQKHARVVGALLQNPRLTEADLLAMLATPEAPATLLSAVARAGRWNAFPALRLALARHRNTPATDALRLLRSLPKRDLQQLVSDPATPTLIRRGAERTLDRRGDAV